MQKAFAIFMFTHADKSDRGVQNEVYLAINAFRLPSNRKRKPKAGAVATPFWRKASPPANKHVLSQQLRTICSFLDLAIKTPAPPASILKCSFVVLGTGECWMGMGMGMACKTWLYI